MLRTSIYKYSRCYAPCKGFDQMGRLRSGNLFSVLRTYSYYWPQASGYWPQASGIWHLASGCWRFQLRGGDLIQNSRIQNWQGPQRLTTGGLSSRGGDLIQDSRIQNWQGPQRLATGGLSSGGNWGFDSRFKNSKLAKPTTASGQKLVAISYWRSQR